MKRCSISMSAGAQVPFSKHIGGWSLCLFAVISPLKCVFYSLCSSRRTQTCNYSLSPEPSAHFSIWVEISKYVNGVFQMAWRCSWQTSHDVWFTAMFSVSHGYNITVDFLLLFSFFLWEHQCSRCSKSPSSGNISAEVSSYMSFLSQSLKHHAG